MSDLATIFNLLSGRPVVAPPAPPVPVVPPTPMDALTQKLGLGVGNPLSATAGRLLGGAIPQPPPAAPSLAPGIKFGLPPAPPAAGGMRSMTIGGGDPLDLAANAIKSIESAGSGGYAAVGPTHPKMGRALGAYQVMESNVGPWTKEILGKELTADQFLADPAAQDAVFKGKFGQAAQKHGNLQDAASVWFTGKPAAEGAGKQDSLGTTGADYVGKFNAAMTGVPGVPQLSAPQLPVPLPTTPMQGMNTAAYDKFDAMTVNRPPPMETSDRITNVLGNMAAAAVGAKDIGSLLLAMGAGAGQGAQENIRQKRKEDLAFGEKEQDLALMKAKVGVEKAGAEQQGANYKIAAENTDAALINQVKMEQTKLDTAAKNRMAELQSDLDWKKLAMFEPQVKADKDGVTIITRQPGGGLKVESTKGEDLDSQADKIRNAAAVYGKDSETVEGLRYQALAKQGEPFVRRQIMRDMVEGNHLAAVLPPEEFKKLQEEAQKGLDVTLRGKPEEWDAQVKKRTLDLLWTQKLKDDLWLPYMLKQGNIGAGLLAQPAR